jgi:hypothetical protein
MQDPCINFFVVLQVTFLQCNLLFNIEKILFYYKTFQVHIPEAKSKKIPGKLYIETKEEQKPQQMKSKEEKVQNQEQK